MDRGQQSEQARGAECSEGTRLVHCGLFRHESPLDGQKRLHRWGRPCRKVKVGHSGGTR